MLPCLNPQHLRKWAVKRSGVNVPVIPEHLNDNMSLQTCVRSQGGVTQKRVNSELLERIHPPKPIHLVCIQTETKTKLKLYHYHRKSALAYTYAYPMAL